MDSDLLFVLWLVIRYDYLVVYGRLATVVLSVAKPVATLLSFVCSAVSSHIVRLCTFS